MKKIVQTGNIRSGSQIKHFISGSNVSKHIYFAARETVAKPMPDYDAILFCSLLRRFSLLRINHFILNSIIMLRNYLSFSSMRMDSAQPKTAIVKPDWAQSGAGTKKNCGPQILPLPGKNPQIRCPYEFYSISQTQDSCGGKVIESKSSLLSTHPHTRFSISG